MVQVGPGSMFGVHTPNLLEGEALSVGGGARVRSRDFSVHSVNSHCSQSTVYCTSYETPGEARSTLGLRLFLMQPPNRQASVSQFG